MAEGEISAQPNHNISLKKYAYIETHPPIRLGAQPTYELFIGRKLPGEDAWGAAQSAGYFDSIKEAVEYARWRGATVNSPN